MHTLSNMLLQIHRRLQLATERAADTQASPATERAAYTQASPAIERMTTKTKNVYKLNIDTVVSSLIFVELKSKKIFCAN